MSRPGATLLAAAAAALLSACTLTQSLDEYSSGEPGSSQGNANKSADAQDGGTPDAASPDSALDLRCTAPSDCPAERPVCCGVSVTAECEAQPIGCDYVLCKTKDDCAPGKGCYPVGQYIEGGGICI